MTEVRESVTLHPETVAKAETLAKEKRKRGPRKPPPEVTKFYTKRPHFVYEGTWAVARTLAGGDVKRMHVESDGSILVTNGHEKP